MAEVSDSLGPPSLFTSKTSDNLTSSTKLELTITNLVIETASFFLVTVELSLKGGESFFYVL